MINSKNALTMRCYNNYAMKIIKSLTVLLFLIGTVAAHAQTADEIINKYFEKTGGKEAWTKLQATKTTASVNQGGMDIPVTIYNSNQGKQAIVVDFQGQSFTQLAFDGETLWTTNLMTMQPEKSKQEMSDNMKLNANDFPSPLLDYKNKGYEAEYVGKDTIEGKETFKVKLTQEPVMVNGTETPSSSFFYFDTKTYYPVAIETMQVGQSMKVNMGNYKEVEGLYFPFALKQGGQPIEVKEIVVNPQINDSIYAFPGK